MKISINGKDRACTDGSTLEQLMNALGYSDTSGMALALNNQVIPKTEWPKQKIQDKDKLTIIKATQGG